MTRKVSIAIAVPLMALLLCSGGCSTINHWERVGQPESHKADVDVGMIVYNAVTTLGLGIIVDVLTGSFWMSKYEQPWKHPPKVTPEPAPRPPAVD